LQNIDFDVVNLHLYELFFLEKLIFSEM